MSLQTLQLMIDTGRIDPAKPIDLAAICNSKAYKIERNGKHFGVNLTSEVSAGAINIQAMTYCTGTFDLFEGHGQL